MIYHLEVVPGCLPVSDHRVAIAVVASESRDHPVNVIYDCRESDPAE